MELRRALRLLGLQKAELSILFVNSSRMKLLNSRYRGISKVTDVLSFPLNEFEDGNEYTALGDIVVCIPRACRQARDNGVTFHDELLRLLLHGLLHLTGYDHEKNSYLKKKMEKKEQELFDAVKTVA